MALAQNCDKEQLCVADLKCGHISSRDAFPNLDLMFAFSALKGVAESDEVFCHSAVPSKHLLLQALDKLV